MSKITIHPKIRKPAWPTLKDASLLARDTWRQTEKAQLLLVASSLAYTTILSIIPLLAVSFAIFKAFGGMDKLYDTIQPFILSNLAQGTSDEVIAHMHGFIDNTHTSTVGVGGFIGLLFTSMSMLSSVEKSINRVWNASITRGLFQRFASYWLFMTLGPLAFAVALGFATSNKIPLTHLLPNGTGIFLLTIGTFFSVYKFVPNCRVNWHYALVSAFFTAVVWDVAAWGYTIYTMKVVSYSKIYGSLGALPILLLWIYIVWVIILLGAALTATLQGRFEIRVKARALADEASGRPVAP